MHGLTIFKQHDAKPTILRFGHLLPSADAAVRLQSLRAGMGDYPFNPIELNLPTVGPFPRVSEVRRELHVRSL
jgi:hypothetical protein